MESITTVLWFFSIACLVISIAFQLAAKQAERRIGELRHIGASSKVRLKNHQVQLILYGTWRGLLDFVSRTKLSLMPNPEQDIILAEISFGAERAGPFARVIFSFEISPQTAVRVREENPVRLITYVPFAIVSRPGLIVSN